MSNINVILAQNILFEIFSTLSHWVLLTDLISEIAY